MEEDFRNLHPFTFIEKYTLEMQKQSNDPKIALKIIELCKDSGKHLKVFKMLSDPYMKRLRKACGKTYKGEYLKFHQESGKFQCNTCACPTELEIGDQCMIAEPIFNDDERKMFMSRVRPWNFHMILGTKKIKIHIWTIKQEDRELKDRWALFMHGFGIDCSKHDWMKWCYPLYQRKYNMIMVDFPGFGRSSGRNLQSIGWKPQSNKMMFTILKQFGAKKNISVFADCGGAATFCKMLISRPKIFSRRHVLIRPTMGRWQPIESVLGKYSIRLWVTWIVDDHHPIHHASQKNWERVRKEMPENLNYVVQMKGYDVRKITYYETQYTPNVTRTKDSFDLFSFSTSYYNRIIKWFDGQFSSSGKK